MPIQIIDENDPTERVTLRGTTFTVRKFMSWDDAEIDRKARKDGETDEVLRYVLRWRHILVGWENLAAADGSDLPFDEAKVAYVRDDGRPGGVGPYLGPDIENTLFAIATAPLVKAEVESGN